MLSEAQVHEAEEDLRVAMLAADIGRLECLLAPDLIFTNFLGHLQSREDDLSAYRSGLLVLTSLTSSDQQVRLHGDVAIVTVRVHIQGKYNGSAANGDFRFTRIWALQPDETMRVLAAHTCQVQ